MTRPDDSSLTAEDLRIVEQKARLLLDQAGAWDRFPVPIDDLLAAAKVRIAPTSLFDPVALLRYLKGKTIEARNRVRSALAKVFGIYDAAESLIHIDSTVVRAKQNFLALHETAHHTLPVHRRMFRFFEECKQTLSPEIADQFEREANNFARFVLFKGDSYAQHAADSELNIKAPIGLARKFGASNYASAREFARTNHRACVVYVLEPMEFVAGDGIRASVRRIEPSRLFVSKFGRPTDTHVTLNHPLGPVLPIGRRMTAPVTLSMTDRNGKPHECMAEAFDTTHNIIVLLYPVEALGKSRIFLPAA